MEDVEKWLVVTAEAYYPGVGVFDSREEAEKAYAETVKDYEEFAHYLRTEQELDSEQDLIDSQDLANRQDKIQVYIAKVVERRLSGEV